ncbi:long-chain-fatty-acid--CoA ligase [Reyranella sp. CPCC 100927]|uniref:long-chain-fatty-acid--CoA ligase n=1 Tax=Reyranella sp. CPCC 100927 TaxID=2599616 RepID=UPI0011B39410|nr:long-chain-fatty-acid--CoA ligase [Reyranella sp. CPCC 100927]TWS97604.1 long-chain-fatty-acid--CoA ligase [Reyranella sp. CPCC 100927]
MLIDSILWQQAQMRPHKVALVCGDRRFTYAETADRTRRLAHALRGLGIQPGQKVAVLATNCAEHAEAVFAIAAIGAVWVPLNFRLSVPELAYIVDDSESVAVICTTDMQASAEGLRDIVRGVSTWISIGATALPGTVLYDDLLRQGSSGALASMAAPDDLFSIMYTSGTTGKPKGVMLPHRRFFVGTILSTIALKATEHDIKLQAIPQFHAGGYIYQLCHMAAGATLVILPRFEPEPTLALMQRERATAAGFVPSMLLALIEAPSFQTADFSALQRVMYGGSPIPEDRLARALERMGAKFLQTYGQTEAGVLVSVLDDADHDRGLRDAPQLLRSCGRAMLGYDIRIVDDAGAPTEGIGELAVRADSLMTGYLKRPDETAATLVDGWLRTGDLGWQDDAGRFYLVDRKKDLIVSGGENVYPIEIEHVLSSHPDVLDVAVIGVPDPRWGEAVKAVIVRRPGTSTDEASLVGFCRGKLGGFKIPKSVDFIDALPRNASGKIQKVILRDRYWAGHARKI